MSYDKFKELLKNERIHFVYQSYYGVKKRCYENGIEDLYALMSYNGDFATDTSMSYETRSHLIRWADYAIIETFRHNYLNCVNNFIVCFQSDFFEISISRYTAGFSSCPFMIVYKNKARNQYAHMKHDDVDMTLDINECYYEYHQISHNGHKSIEYEISIPDSICYKFVLNFTHGKSNNSIYEMKCTNEIVTEKQLNDVLFFHNDLSNRKYIAYKFLKEIGLLNQDDIKNLTNKELFEHEELVDIDEESDLEWDDDAMEIDNSEVNDDDYNDSIIGSTQLQENSALDKRLFCQIGEVIYEDDYIKLRYCGVLKKGLLVKAAIIILIEMKNEYGREIYQDFPKECFVQIPNHKTKHECRACWHQIKQEYTTGYLRQLILEGTFPSIDFLKEDYLILTWHNLSFNLTMAEVSKEEIDNIVNYHSISNEVIWCD